MAPWDDSSMPLIQVLYRSLTSKLQIGRSIAVQKYLCDIPQANETYNVVGNGNEYGLVIGESTFGGVDVLAEKPKDTPGIDYGSLIYVTLQRARTAREAIRTMVQLMGRSLLVFMTPVPCKIRCSSIVSFRLL